MAANGGPAMRILLALASWLSWSCAFAACPPAGYDRAGLEALQAAKFAMPDAASRNALAFASKPCSYNAISWSRRARAVGVSCPPR